MYKYFMNLAIEEAKKAASEGEVPVGAVIVKDDQVLSKAHNKTRQLNDPTAHAEILAIREACKKIGNYRLVGCELYITLEPCPMCAGAILWSRISKVYYGTKDYKSGSAGTLYNILQDSRLNHYVAIESHMMEDENKSIIKEFFRDLRKNKRDEKGKS